MSIPNIFVHLTPVRSVIEILKLWHVRLRAAVVVVHRTLSVILRQTLVRASRPIQVVLDLLVPGLGLDIGYSPSCLHLFGGMLVIHFLKRILVKVDRLSICLRCDLII